jgi:hypothetical protein
VQAVCGISMYDRMVQGLQLRLKVYAGVGLDAATQMARLAYLLELWTARGISFSLIVSGAPILSAGSTTGTPRGHRHR